MFSSMDLQAACHGVTVLRRIRTDAMLLALAALVIVMKNNGVALKVGFAVPR